MNLTNARIGKLWAAGLRDIPKIARKIGRPGPAGEDRVLRGLLTLQDRGEVTGVPVLVVDSVTTLGRLMAEAAEKPREDEGADPLPPEK